MKKTFINETYQENSEITHFMSNLPVIFEETGTTIFKGRNVIKEFIITDIRLVVKRFKRPHIFQRVIYTFFRKTKASRAFYNAFELEKRNVKTPSPIACMETYQSGLFLYGYYVSLFTEEESIKGKLVDQEIFDRPLARAFAEFIVFLHKNGILHHDLNPTNVLYLQNNNKYIFSLIDINRMNFFPKSKIISKYDCFENLTRITWRMDLYQYVLEHYIKLRGWNSELINEALSIKQKHAKAWRRRKDFLAKFKKKK